MQLFIVLAGMSYYLVMISYDYCGNLGASCGYLAPMVCTRKQNFLQLYYALFQLLPAHILNNCRSTILFFQVLCLIYYVNNVLFIFHFYIIDVAIVMDGTLTNISKYIEKYKLLQPIALQKLITTQQILNRSEKVQCIL